MVLVIKKLLSLLTAAALFLQTAPCANAGMPADISAESAVVMHEGGRVIYGKNPDKRMLIASTTKLMTAILAIENCSLSDNVEIKPEYCTAEGSSMYLEQGDVYTAVELLKGLLLVSGNDAAVALACHTSGTEEDFVKLMNEKARELGMENSHFENPHGLDSPHHYSTAEDLAILMAYCMKNPAFASLTSLESTVIGEQTLINHNRLLKLCAGCEGGKTGYTDSAGRCLVSCCMRNGTRFICVTLNAPDDWNDHIKLYNWAFSNYSWRNVTENITFTVPVISGTEKEAVIGAEKVGLLLEKDDVLSLRAELPWFEFAPVRSGGRAGEADIFLNGEKIAGAGLFYRDSIPVSDEYKVD